MRPRFILPSLALIATILTSAACAQDAQSVKVDTVFTRAGDVFHVEAKDADADKGIDKRFEPVINALVSRGWPENQVREKFRDKRTVFIPKMVKVTIKKSGRSKNYYTWVNTEESADACRTFIDKYRTSLESAEKKYGVDKETIAALIRCETRHGQITGDYHVFSVYASMALLNESDYINANLDRAKGELKKASKKTVARQVEYIEKRSKSRATWAYRELENLMKMSKDKHVNDMLAIYGSWAGAFGWSQFLPSSFLRSAADGDGDGIIDLFNPADAIHSAANYLDKAGYRTGDAGSQRRALHNYNNSTDYVNSIYGLAQRVRSGGKEF